MMDTFIDEVTGKVNACSSNGRDSDLRIRFPWALPETAVFARSFQCLQQSGALTRLSGSPFDVANAPLGTAVCRVVKGVCKPAAR
jgi:hypothetical protein